LAEVKFDTVWKKYKREKVDAVKGLDISLKDGEFVSLLGPSGCGKSSTLRMVAGLEEISSGDLYIGGRRVNDLEPGERDVAMVFENYALLPHMTAFDNIAFPLRLQNENKKVIECKVKEIADFLEMGCFLYEKAHSLGGGQRQRVGIARALIRKSSVLLMDEPISHLDADLRAKTRGELARLQKLLGITTIYVTHDQIEALAMADRIAVMNFGVLQQYGEPDELYNYPTNKFVASFIGEPPMNFLPCALSRENGNVVLASKDFEVTLDKEAAREIDPDYPGGDVLLGVRPPDIELKFDSSDEANVVKGKCVLFSAGCEHSVLEASIGDNIILAQCSPDILLKPEQNLSIKLVNKKFHLFDSKTERTIIKNIMKGDA